jgi:uncharacterized protein YdhG (YjbR/CyaY superfamily)
MPDKPTTIDEYIVAFPSDVQAVLQAVRRTIQEEAPSATETISYGMPAFKMERILVYFAGWQEHIGMYPPVADTDPQLKADVARYAGPKGNLKFPLSEPMPYDLIRRVVRHRIAESASAAYRRRG